MRKLSELIKKKQELLERISNYETEKKVIAQTVEKLTASYNIGEIDFKDYQRRYQEIFSKQTPEQKINHCNIQIRSLTAQLSWCEQQIGKFKGDRKEAQKGVALQEGLRGRIAEAEEKKGEVISEVNKLTKLLDRREISYGEYKHRLANDFGGKKPQDWINYYEAYISDCHNRLSQVDSLTSPSPKKSLVWKFIPVLIGVLFISFALYQYLPGALLTGFATEGSEDEIDEEPEEESPPEETEEEEPAEAESVEEDPVEDVEVETSSEENEDTDQSGEGQEEETSEETEDEDVDEETNEGEETSEETEDEDVDEETNEDEEENDEAGNESGEGFNETEEGDSDSIDFEGNETELDEEEIENNVTDDDRVEDILIEDELGEDEIVEEESLEEIIEIPTNVTIPFLYREFPDMNLEFDEKVEIDLGGYFVGADEYFVSQIEGAITTIEDDLLMIESDRNFTGYAEVKIIASNEFGTTESNEFTVFIAERIIEEGPEVEVEIPDIEILAGEDFILNVSEFIVGWDEFFVLQIEDIEITTKDELITFSPYEGFLGSRIGKLIATNERGSFESNAFNISVVGELTPEIDSAIENITTLQYKAVIGRPTRWLKVVNVTSENDTLVTIPKESQNISVKTGDEIDEALAELEEYEELLEEAEPEDFVFGGITGNVVSDLDDQKGIITKLWEWLTGFTITGNVVSEEELEGEIIETADEKIVDLGEVVNQTGADELAVEYYTGGPQAFESEIPGGKRIVVSGDDDLGYVDVLTYAEIPEVLEIGQENEISLYWVENATFMEFESGDINSNGLLDYVEWITPHLSDQTFLLTVTEANSTTNITEQDDFSHLAIDTTTAPYDDLIMYLPFDKTNSTGTAAYDFSANDNDGTFWDGASLNGSGGYIGDSVVFDNVGTPDHIRFPSGVVNTGSNNMTFSTWVNAQGIDTVDMVFSVFPGFSDEFNLAVRRSGLDYWRIQYEIGSEALNANIVNCDTDPGKWQHMAVVTNDTGLAVYINGSSCYTYNFVSTSNAYSALNAGSAFYIGTRNGIASELNGSIDEFLIFNTSLTASEISSLYSGQSAKFHGGGELVFENIGDLTGETTVNITLGDCQTNNGSSINAKVNDGSYSTVSGCVLNDYSLSGISNLANANVTVQLLSNSENFYSPLIIDNVTVLSFGEPDTTPPLVSFQGSTPADGSTQENTNIVVNVSSSDDNGDHYSIVDFDNDLVLWLRFEDVNSSGDPLDNSSYDQSVSVNGGSVQTTSGKIASGFDFDFAGDYLEIPLSDSTNFSEQDFSIAAWVKPNNNVQFQPIAGQGNPYNVDGNGWRAYWRDSNRFGLSFNNGSGSNAGGNLNYYDISGTWQHVVFTFDRDGNALIYVNGTQEESIDISSKELGITSEDPLRISANGASTTTGWNGTLDEVMIFKRVLTATEIGAIYNATATQYYNDFTGLSLGNHNFTSYAVDRAGNKNETETRTVTIESLDTTNPLISFQGDTPADSSTQGGTDIVVDVSSSDTEGDHYVLTDFDNDLLGWWRFEGAINNYTQDSETDGASDCALNPTWAHDEDFSTNTGNGGCDIYTNYTIPIGATESTMIEVRSNEVAGCSITYDCYNYSSSSWVEFGANPGGDTRENVSLSGFSGCFAGEKLQLRYDMSTSCTVGLFYEDQANWVFEPVDESSYANNLTVFGDTTNTSSGYYGRGASFDGSGDYFEVGGDQNQWAATGEEFTVSAFVYMTDTGDYDTVFSWGAYDPAIYLQAPSGVNWEINWLNPTDNTLIVDTRSGPEWHHMAVTRNSTNGITAYWDGAYAGMLRASDTDALSGKQMRIGFDSYSGDEFTGTIDDAMYFNRSLNDSEIAALYNATANQYLYSFTNLDEGAHTFTSYAVDGAGNKNQTETRTVTIQLGDTTSPSIDLAYPTTESGDINDNLYVNLSTSDDNNHYSFVELDNDVLLWLHMNSVNSTGDPYDNSSYSANASLKNNAVINSTGEFGNSSWFDGSGDYIEVIGGSEIDFDASASYTWSAWVYPRQFSSSHGGIIRMCSEVSTPGAGYSIFIDATGDLVLYDCDSSPEEKTSTGSLTEDAWNHIAINYSNGDYTFFINGATSGSGSFTSIADETSTDLLIGDSYSTFANPDMDGAIDEVIIFNRSLDLGEIQALYNATANQYDGYVHEAKEGAYSFKGYTVDSGNNINLTGTRSVTIDNTNPIIDYNPETPGNGIKINSNTFRVNTSSSDSYDTYTFTEFDDDLLLWLTMDDINASGAPTDQSGRSHDADPFGNARRNFSGYWGEGFVFDGSGDYISVNEVGTRVANDDEKSWSFWLYDYTDAKSGNALFGTVSSGTSNCGAGDGFQFYLENPNILKFEECDSLGSISTTTWSGVGVWTHVVVTRDGTATKIYVNGTERASGTVSMVSNTNPLLIGYGPGPDGDGIDEFSGIMDDFIVFNRTLNASDISSLYNSSANEYGNTFGSFSNGDSLTFQSYTVDRAGNRVNEEERTVTIDLADPEIDFVSPTTDEGKIDGDSIFVNLSTSDNEHYSFVDFDSDVLVWLRMDDINGSGEPTDSSEWSNNGSVYGNAEQSGDGSHGEGFYLDGDDGEYILIPNDNEMNGGLSNTISIWAKPSSTDPNGWVFSAYESVTENIGIREVSNTWRVWYDLGDAGDSSINLGSIDSGWQHIVVIFNQSGSFGYKNGVYVDGDTSLPGSFINLSNPDYFIGYNGGSLNWNGTVDEVIVFNRTLSLDEIEALYNSSVNSYQNNFTTLDDGTHSFIGYVVDEGGNTNQTESRSVLIDNTNPSVSFVGETPADDSVRDVSDFVVNLSSSDLLDHYSFVDFDNDLLLWMRMDDVNGTGEPTDLSTWSHNGTIVNDAVQNISSGAFGDSFYFDGTGDILDLRNSDAFETHKFTLTFWARPDDVSDNKAIFSSSNGRPSFLLLSGRLYYSYINSTGSQIQETSPNANDVTANEWHMYSLVIDDLGSEVNVSYYKDGSYLGNDLGEGGHDSTVGSDYVIGAYRTSDGIWPMDGNLDEILLFNRTLSDQEIRALYNSTADKYYRNFTNLDDADYDITGYAVDTSGNKNQTETRNVSVSKPDEPNVIFVESIGSQLPLENSTRNVEFTVTVEDLDGVGQISTVEANFSYNGITRFNSTCSAISGESTSTTENYSCSIDMWYFDEPGDWTIGINVSDSTSRYGYNSSETFTYGVLYAFVTNKDSISFSGDQGDENVTSTDDPITMTNYGNANITDIKITGTNLYGVIDNSYYIDVANVSVGNETGGGNPECGGTSLTNGTNATISNTELLRGNYSLGSGVAEEELYFCMTTVPTGLLSQDYSTSQEGSWTIYISLAALGVAGAGAKKRKKRKKKLNEENLLEVLEEKLVEKYNIGLNELLDRVKEDYRDIERVQIPIDVLKQEIGASESLCKYLKENRHLTFSEIARLLNRDQRTVWINYRNAKRKKKERIQVRSVKLTIPIKVLRDRRMSLLESVIYYLRGKGMKNSEIAIVLNKDPRNTSLLYSRAIRKTQLKKRNI